MFDPAYPTAKLTGVEYNPRTIGPETEAMLRESIQALGFCKPILVTQGGRIIAGHQRTNAARALGMATVPAFVLPSLDLSLEMRLNQLHNGSDVDSVPIEVRVPPMPGQSGFAEVKASAIVGEGTQPGAALRKEIYNLISRFGPWGCAVATESGEVLSSAHYALASRMTGKPLRVFVLPDAKGDAIRRYFGQSYGKFDYSRLPRQSYVQAFAQPNRRAGKDGTDGLSASYREVTKLPKTARILDFGCGQGQTVALAKAMGHDVLGVEFFYRGMAYTRALKPRATHAMIDAVCESLSTKGLFDAVLADSVINSVDSLDSIVDVLACLNAFCKPGGTIFFSGRAREGVEKGVSKASALDVHGGHRSFELFDDNGFTTIPRGELWFFQKFHTRDEVDALCREFIGPEHKKRHGPCWQAWGIKSVEVTEARKRLAIEREFDLPWPAGRRVGRSAQALAAYEAARKLSANA